MIDAVTLAANLARVRDQVAGACARAGRSPADVTIIAVTKTVPAATIALARELGVRVVGENRVQEARTKASEVAGLRWELIGPLQRNKVRAALATFARIQTVADASLARDLERVAAETDQVVPVLIQVNVAGEISKHGIAPDLTLTLAETVASLPHLRGEGLMTIAPFVTNPEEVRPIFAQLRTLRDQVQERIPGAWTDLSMGMTADFAVAIAEGATHVRIGRAIFGER